MGFNFAGQGVQSYWTKMGRQGGEPRIVVGLPIREFLERRQLRAEKHHGQRIRVHFWRHFYRLGLRVLPECGKPVA